jgi:hypothetical protein
LGAALVVLVGASQSAHADIIYDNFIPGDGYDIFTGWLIGNPSGSEAWVQGDPFIVSGTYTLSQITVAASYVGGPNVFTVYLMDDADGVPGNVIEEFDFVDLGYFGNYNAPLVAASSLNPTLEDGQVYWLVAVTTDTTWAAWNFNKTGDTGAHAQQVNGGDWTIVDGIRGAFRIEADPVTGPNVPKRPAAKLIALPAAEIAPNSITSIP